MRLTNHYSNIHKTALKLDLKINIIVSSPSFGCSSFFVSKWLNSYNTFKFSQFIPNIQYLKNEKINVH